MSKQNKINVILFAFMTMALLGVAIAWRIRSIEEPQNVTVESAATAPTFSRVIPDVASDLPEKKVVLSGGESKDETLARVALRRFYKQVDGYSNPQPLDENAIKAFAEGLRAIPTSRRMEGLHRAMNLVPDENIALLNGVLFDEKETKEIVKAVFSNIVNRPETVKDPIVREILKDKNHPCYKDAEWICRVTGEK